jgi:eukaryotic-like serine/threonine-protein kinase
MSPRRRLRTRYEPEGEPPAPPAIAPPQVPEPVPAADGSAPPAAVPAPGPPEPIEPPRPAPAPAPASSYSGPPPVPMGVEPLGEPAEAFEVLVPTPGPPIDARAPLPARSPRRRTRAFAALGTFALLAFVTGFFVFNNLVMPRLIHGVGQITVPDLTNLTIEQAEQVLRPLGLQISRAGERFDPSAPRGFVLSQEPAAGTGVRGNKRISVLVSLGEEFSSVPELFGESVRAARILIDRAGLRPGTTVRAPSDEVGEGLVAGSDPAAETVLPRDTPVHLLVSSGPGRESFVMPDLLGRELAGVRRQLDALGFRVEMIASAPSLGTIVSQGPPPGSRITRADVIRLQATGRMIR